LDTVRFDGGIKYRFAPEGRSLGESRRDMTTNQQDETNRIRSVPVLRCYLLSLTIIWPDVLEGKV
jgi:hypothetical protein